MLCGRAMRRLALGTFLAVLFAPAATAKPLLGVFGPIDRFESLTGQRSDVGHAIFGWGPTSR
jgi:hypothetical protein